VQDITARRKAEQGLHHLAFHDSLTGLPNRRRFHELLSQAVMQRDPPRPRRPAYAVMFLDFDRFKLINDSLGHNAGDEFLVQVSTASARACARTTWWRAWAATSSRCWCATWTHERSAVHLAERLMDALRQPFHVAGTELMTSASIGITFSALGYTTPRTCCATPTPRCTRPRAPARRATPCSTPACTPRWPQRLRLEGDLRHAIDDKGQLSVVYQPLYELASGRCTASRRWCAGATRPTAPSARRPSCRSPRSRA
jgi:diguanylate cyclase (GGDEF)-like protein